MLLAIEESDDRPLYQQLAASVRHAIARGEMAPGESLPPTRQAAAALGVNPETVQRAYRLLVDDGLVVSRVGRGTQVRHDVDRHHLALDDAIAELVTRADRMGWSRQALAERILQD